MKLQINPFLYREMRRYAGSRKFYIWLFIYEAFLTVVTGVGYHIALHTSWDQIMNYSGAAYVYFILAGILGLIVLLIVPSFAAGSLASEWEDRTMELLLAASVKPSEIVVGKLLSSVCLAILLVVAGMPFLSVAFIVGGIQKKHLIQFLLLLVMESVFIGSIGVSLSAACQKVDMAGLQSYAASMGLSVGTALVVVVVYIIERTSQGGGDIVQKGAFGGVMLILLFNPLITMASLLTDQMGYRNKFQELLCVLGPVPEFVMMHWCLISILIQMMISLILLVLSKRKVEKYYL